MKAVFVTGENSVSVKDVPTPQVGGGDVLVRMRACGLCGSDLEKVYGNYGWMSKRLGHEPAGEIVAAGKNVKDFKVGDRVFVHHHVPCYSCHYCSSGDVTMCPQYSKSNLEPCGLAEVFLVPEWNVSRGGMIQLPADMSYEEAAMIEPLACCLRAINKALLQKDDSIAVFGAGPAGVMHIMLAKYLGAGKVFAIDMNEFRLEFAKKMGVDISINPAKQDAAKIIKEATEGRGADIAITATGSSRAFLQSLEVLRPGGRAVLFGVPPRGSDITFDLNSVFTNEIRIIPSLAASEVETKQVCGMIAARKLDVKPLITHRFSIEHAGDAVQCAHEAKDAMKVVVTA